MTVTNIHIAPDKIWLVTDTLYYVAGQPYSLGTKASVYPHLMTVLGFRGLSGLHHQADVWLNGGGRILSVDEAAAGLPHRLKRWQHELLEERPHLAGQVKGQAWLAGWSPLSRSFVGWRIAVDADLEVAPLAVPSTHIAPGCEDAGYSPPAEIDHPDKLIRCVEVQREMSLANMADGGGDLGIGGEAILIQLDRSGFRISKAHRFADYAETKELIRNGR